MQLDCRIEMYSCKMSPEQKKLSRRLRQDYLKDVEHLSYSSKGKLEDPEMCKVYGFLISTLNLSFPDYDFSNVKPDHFCCVESTSHAINEINRRLCEVPDIDFGSVWSEIDSAIQLRNCLVYSYLSDLSDDPLSEGQIWSFNYFFYNKELKKVLFFACTARSAFSGMETPDSF